MKRFIIASLLSLSAATIVFAQPGIKASNMSADASQRNFPNLAAAKALETGPLINLRNGEVFHIDGLGTYYWRASSTTTGDDDTVIKLTTYVTGRLHKIAGLTTGTTDGKLLTGQYDAGTGSLPAANAGDWFEVGTTGTIGGQAFVDGEWWQALNDVASGNTAPIVASWTRRRLSPTVAGSGVIEVANDTELRALAATTIGQVVYLQGHASAGDHPTIQMVDVGTGGVDDGGATLVSTAGRTYELSPAYRLFPEHYGATYYASDTSCEAGANNDGPLLQAFSDALATGKWEGDSNKGFIRTTQQINFEMRTKYRGQAQFYFPISYDGIGVRIFSNNDAYQRSPERRLLIRAWHGRNTPQDAHWVGKDYAATWDRGIVNGGGQEVQETLLNETSVGVLIDAVKYATLDIEQQGFCVGVSLDGRTNAPNNENAWNDIRVLSSLISKFPVALISRSGSNQWCSQNTIWTGPLLRSGTTAGQSVYGVCLVHDGTASAGSLSGNRISTGGIEATIDGGDELAQVYFHGGENTTLHVRTDLQSVHYTAKFYEHSNRLDSARDNVVYTERKGLVQNNGYANFVNLTGALPHIGAVADYTDLYERVYYSTGTGAGTRASVRGLRLSESLVRTAPVSASGVHVESADKTVNVNFANRLAQVVRMNTSESKEDLLELLIETKNETDVRFVIFPRDANGNDITSNLQPDGTETIRSTDQAISFSGNQFFAGGNVGTTRKRFGFHPNVAEATIAVHGDSISGVIYRWLNSAGSFTIDKDELPIVQGSPVRGEFVDPAIVLSYDANGTEILRLKTTGDSASARPFSTGMSLFHSEWVVVNQGTGNERYWELVTDGDTNGLANGTDLAAHVPSAVGDTFTDNSTDVWKYVTTVQKLSSWQGDPVGGGSGQQIVTSTGAMTALTIADGETVSYSTAFGGSSDFRYAAASTATVDNVMVVNGAGGAGRYLRQHDGALNMLWWQSGSSITDGEIQAAMTYAAISGIPLRAPAGSYVTTSTKTIPTNTTKFTMFGDGKDITRFTSTAAGVPAFDVSDSAFTRLSDFRIDGNATTGHLIRAADTDVGVGTFYPQHLTLERLRLSGSTGSDVDFNSSSPVHAPVAMPACGIFTTGLQVTIKDCLVETCDIGIYAFKGNTIIVDHCIISANVIAGMVDHACEKLTVGNGTDFITNGTAASTFTLIQAKLIDGNATAVTAQLVIVDSQGSSIQNSKFKQGTYCNISSSSKGIPNIGPANWIRTDGAAANSYGIFLDGFGAKIHENEFEPAVENTGTSATEIYGDFNHSRTNYFGEISQNTFSPVFNTKTRRLIHMVGSAASSAYALRGAIKDNQYGQGSAVTVGSQLTNLIKLDAQVGKVEISGNDWQIPNNLVLAVPYDFSAATVQRPIPIRDELWWQTNAGALQPTINGDNPPTSTTSYFAAPANAYMIDEIENADVTSLASGQQRTSIIERTTNGLKRKLIVGGGGSSDTHQTTYNHNDLTFTAVGDATELRALSSEISSNNFTMDTTTGTAGTSIGQYGFTNPIPRQGQFSVEIVVGTGIARFELNDENGNAIRYDVNKATGATTTSIVGGAATTTVPYEQVRGGRIVITAGYNFTEQSKNSGSIRVSPNTSGAGSVIWDFTIKGYYQPDNGTSTQIDLAKYQDFYLGVDIDTDTINSLEFINARESQSGFIVWQYGDPGSATWTNADFYSVGPPDLSSQTTSDFGSATYIVENGVVRITYIEP